MASKEYTLIITEKPNASKKIAEALADKKAVKKADKTVPYYELTHDGKNYVVACAVGHLYGLTEKEKSKGFSYPVFDIEWVPTASTSKSAAFSKKYLTTMKKLAKGAKGFIVATDFDVEGEVIGYNVLRFACKQKDAKRMKFSTLTKGDLQKSFKNIMPTLAWGQANAGLTRHSLDWFYGINLSRALSSAIKTTGLFKILSAGRVQGPALKILVDRDKEIKAFKPVPYWQIELTTAKGKKHIKALHTEDKFWEKDKADKVYNKVKSEKTTTVAKTETSRTKQQPPYPFDLTTLQTEAHRTLRISPKATLEIAQNLYTSGVISYPRTSSQQYPESIEYKKIIDELKKQDGFVKEVEIVKKGNMKPNNGKKTDPAHPAIYPTGNIPEGLDTKAAGVYELVVRRFLSTFGEPAVRETMKITFDIKKELFVAKGTRTVEKGWYELYGRFVKVEEEEFPDIKEKESLPVKKIDFQSKETQPPKRYTEASIIKELEKRNLGTKATRANIIDTLQKRNYVQGKQLEATDLGTHIVGVLEKNCPKIVDEALTKHFEDEMEDIYNDKRTKDDILKEAKSVLNKILKEFKEKEKDIGAGLKDTLQQTRTAQSTVGQCPACGDGLLMMRRGKFGRFVACDKYPDCKTTFSLPNTGLIQVSEKLCSHCDHPIITIIRKGKRPNETCIYPDCHTKKVEAPKEKKICPKCKKGEMVVRKSVYGAFLACNKFPKCKNTENLQQNED